MGAIDLDPASRPEGDTPGERVTETSRRPFQRIIGGPMDGACGPIGPIV